MINRLGSVPSVNSVGTFGTVKFLNSSSDMPLSRFDDLVVERGKFLWVGFLPQGTSKIVSSPDIRKVLQ